MIIRSLHIKPDISQLPILYAFCEDNGIGNQALLALEEAIVNIANYSSANHIELKYEDRDEAQHFILVDDGIMFDPTAYAPNEKNADQLIAGGQGIRIMRKMMDSISYQRTDNKNILTLVKNKK